MGVSEIYLRCLYYPLGIKHELCLYTLSIFINSMKTIFMQVATVLLNQLYTASNLTQDEGKKVTDSVPLMAAILPTIQQPVEEVAESLAQEPLLQALKNFSSVGGLVGCEYCLFLLC
jgi:hypothetical protein